MSSLAPYAIYFKAAAIVALVAAGAGASWWMTSTYHEKIAALKEVQHQQAVIIAQQNATDAANKGHAITDKINADAAADREARLRNTIANLQRVTQYVTPETDRDFPLPCGFVRLHDAAARGIPAAAVSLPAGKADGDRCDVATSVAAGIVQRNYFLAMNWKGEVESWWRWYDQQAANWDAYLAKTTARPRPLNPF